MLKEEDAISGINCTERGPTNISGRTRSILINAVELSGNTLFTEGIGGGLWKSTNESTSWSSINVFADGTISTTDDELLAGVPIVPKGQKLQGQFFPLLFDPAELE